MKKLTGLPLSLSALVSLPFVVGGCGGITKEAKVANAIEVILASTIESFAQTQSGSTTVTGKCGNGSGTDNGGTLSYSLPSGLTDPFALIQFIQANPNQVPLALSFTNCVIKVCGDTLTLNGTTAQLILGVSAQDLLQNSAVPAKFTVALTSVPATGFITGNVTFSYVLNAAFTSNSLSSLTIQDASPAVPYTDSGTTFNGADILTLADGC